MKLVTLLTLAYDYHGSERIVAEAELGIGNGESRTHLKVSGRVSKELAAKIILMIEQELGAQLDATPTATGEPPEFAEVAF